MSRRLPPMECIKRIVNSDGSIPPLRNKPKVRLAWHRPLESHCWVMLSVKGRELWHGSYALVALEDGRQVAAHRYFWVMDRRCEVPAGHVVHHTCFEKRCVNPAHLAVCTFGRNSQLSNFAERAVERFYTEHTLGGDPVEAAA
jgi:hypothetical protein